MLSCIVGSGYCDQHREVEKDNGALQFVLYFGLEELKFGKNSRVKIEEFGLGKLSD